MHEDAKNGAYRLPPTAQGVAADAPAGVRFMNDLYMPCAGSDGTGETMTFDLTYIAEIAS